MANVLVFDVNETLLDLKALAPAFAAAVGSDAPMGEWFARMLHGSLVANHVGDYRPFDHIGIEALVVTAQKRGVDLSPDAAAVVVEQMESLPPHPDVVPTLLALDAAGWRMVALTNGSQHTANRQLANAGLTSLFDQILSVESVRKFKPAPETYLWAAMHLGADIDDVLMVAAHDWDIIGARSVGCEGAFIARPGAIWGLPTAPPELIGTDLSVLLTVEAT